jgi:hypothetical protein
MFLKINQDVKPESLHVEVKFQKTSKLLNQGRFMQMPDPLHVEDYHKNEKKEEEYHNCFKQDTTRTNLVKSIF